MLVKTIKPFKVLDLGICQKLLPEAEASIFWPSHEMINLPRKDPDVGKVRRQKDKGTTEDEMVG